MNKNKSSIFVCIFAATSASGWRLQSPPFASEWGWNNSPGTMTFSINLEQ